MSILTLALTCHQFSAMAGVHNSSLQIFLARSRTKTFMFLNTQKMFLMKEANTQNFVFRGPDFARGPYVVHACSIVYLRHFLSGLLQTDL
jgi:hypothetical protein